jgi:hypothetical protein
MQNRLSLADLKAKNTSKVLASPDIFTGGADASCHGGKKIEVTPIKVGRHHQ